MSARGVIGRTGSPAGARVLDGGPSGTVPDGHRSRDRVERVHRCSGWTPGDVPVGHPASARAHRRGRLARPTGVQHGWASGGLSRTSGAFVLVSAAAPLGPDTGAHQHRTNPVPGTQEDSSPSTTEGRISPPTDEKTRRQPHQKINQQRKNQITNQTDYDTSNNHYPSPQVTSTTTESHYTSKLPTRSNEAHPCTTVRWGCAAAAGGRDHPERPNTPTSTVGGRGTGGGWLRWC